MFEPVQQAEPPSDLNMRAEQASADGQTPGLSLDGLFVYDLSGRSKLRFAGPQALWFLDQLVTNKVDDLPPGTGAEALLLSPNGRITSQLRILHLPAEEGETQEVLVDAPEGHAGRLVEFFTMRVFATKVQISDVSEEFAILRVIGAGADQAVEAVGFTPPEAEPNANMRSPASDDASGLAARVQMPSRGADLWVAAATKHELVDRLVSGGARVLDEGEYESLRVAAGVPAYGKDFDETYRPQEAAFEYTVHFAKGCYLGQEAVAMAQRGKIKRRLRHLEFEGPGRTGAAVQDEKEAGRVTSAASWKDRWYGIGTLNAEVQPGDKVTLGVGDEAAIAGRSSAAEAVVRDLPGTTYGPRVPSARELRERLTGG